MFKAIVNYEGVLADEDLRLFELFYSVVMSSSSMDLSRTPSM